MISLTFAKIFVRGMRRLIGLLILCTSMASAQTQRIRVMTYNLMYYRASAPCSHSQGAFQRDDELKTIFDFASPTVMLVNELGSGVSTSRFLIDQVINTQGTTNYDIALSTNNGFSSIVNQVIFDTTLVGLHSQDYLTKDLNNQDLVRAIDIYHMYYKDPKLSEGADTVFFHLISAHLKAGSGSSERLERQLATERVMDYVSANLADENVIMAGDFNIQSSSEPSFMKLINYSDTSARFYDPVNQLGSWNNNSNFAAIHTQSTHAVSSGCHSGGGLDDRFDFLLVSDEIQQGSHGVKYYPNSYQVLGNDGNHFNQSINAGNNTSAPSNIIDALYNLSDHLPVMMSLDIDKSDLALAPAPELKGVSFNNPAHNLLSLRNKQAGKFLSVRITAITGKLMKEIQWVANSTEMDIECGHWPAGIYLLRLTNAHGAAITRKLIVN